MAKITITIEDKDQNRVQIVSDPTVETMFKMHLSGHQMTSAHGFAIRMLNAARDESKRNGPHKILIPRVGKI